jgi:hypothetical protein
MVATHSLETGTVSGDTVTTETVGGGGAAGSALLRAQACDSARIAMTLAIRVSAPSVGEAWQAVGVGPHGIEWKRDRKTMNA